MTERKFSKLSIKRALLPCLNIGHWQLKKLSTYANNTKYVIGFDNEGNYVKVKTVYSTLVT